MNETNKTVAEIVADVIFDEHRISHVFSVTGGGAMFLNDAFGKHSGGQVVYNHHEQASAMAAVGFAKATNGLGVAVVTTGCGCTNALTGLLDAWQDNVPVVFISGQVKKRDTSRLNHASVRQIGVQELDIVAVVESMTKYAVMVEEPAQILYEMDKAISIAKSGRPGPVWIDIPLDVQASPLNIRSLDRFLSPYTAPRSDRFSLVWDSLRKAERPVIIAGNGIRLSGSRHEFQEFLSRFAIPSVFSYLSIDLLPFDHPLAIGRLGTKGDRPGNFCVQNADLVISLGCRLSVPLTGFEFDKFARDAELIVIDVDPEEHQKGTVEIDLFIESDVRMFFESALREENTTDWSDWISTCNRWKSMWPVHQDVYSEQQPLNLYESVESLHRAAPDGTHFVTDAGSAYYVPSQALKIRGSQRYHTSGAQADMGFTLPAAIGVCMAFPSELVIGITGDGSFQMNIQELQVLVQLQPNLKLVVWNNDGYLSIKATQTKFFDKRYSGSGPASGVTMPSTKKICDAYGLPYHYAGDPATQDLVFCEAFAKPGPVIIELSCQPEQEIIPNVSALKRDDGSLVSKPLEDMYPFLDRDEFLQEMIIPPVDGGE